MSLPTLADALAYLAASTNYEARPDWSYRRLGLHLEGFRDFCARRGDPQRRLAPAVIVAGTKGKGTVVRLVEAALQAAGRVTGAFLSPHLESITERIRVDGAPLSEPAFCATLDALRPALSGAKRRGRALTFFEILTAMAFSHFAEARVEVALLEVGLGGRLDATNIVDAEIAAIPSLGYEHTDKLGTTLTTIAGEKAGVFRAGQRVVLGPSLPDEARSAFLRAIAAVGAIEQPLAAPRTRLAAPRTRLDNERVAASVLDALAAHDGRLSVAAPLREAAFAGLGIPGRQERFSVARYPPAVGAVQEAAPASEPAARAQAERQPVSVILDAAHDALSFRALADSLAAQAGARTGCVPAPILVIGMNADKVREVFQSGRAAPALPASAVIVTRVPGARAIAPEALRAVLREAWGESPGCREATVIDDPEAALRAGLARASHGRQVVVAGSFYLAGVLRPLLVTWSRLAAV